jgi:nucleoside-diphosphate-sugar epimerase
MVLGYSGFFGRHFLKYCKSKQHELLLIGRSPSPVPLDIKDQWIQTGLTEFQMKLDPLKKIDVLVNFVWQGLPLRTTELNSININLHRKILGQLQGLSFDKVLCVGSCLEYPKTNYSLTELEPINKRDEFSKTKNEIYKMYLDNFEYVVWPRVFFAYGSGQHQKSLLNVAYNSFSKNDDFVLQSPGEIQDFVHISDVVRAFEMLISKANCRGIFNIGSGHGIQNQQLCEILFTLMLKRGMSTKPGNFAIFPQNPDVHLSKVRVSNNFKIGEEVGWYPQISIEAGVQEFLEGKNR